MPFRKQAVRRYNISFQHQTVPVLVSNCATIGESCFTLQQYILSLSNNITLELYPGIKPSHGFYRLLVKKNVISFTMRATCNYGFGLVQWASTYWVSMARPKWTTTGSSEWYCFCWLFNESEFSSKCNICEKFTYKQEHKESMSHRLPP